MADWGQRADHSKMSTAEQTQLPVRERRPSTSAPVVGIHGAVGPVGMSRPKHRRTTTGLGSREIKSIVGASLVMPLPRPRFPWDSWSFIRAWD